MHYGFYVVFLVLSIVVIYSKKIDENLWKKIAERKEIDIYGGFEPENCKLIDYFLLFSFLLVFIDENTWMFFKSYEKLSLYKKPLS